MNGFEPARFASEDSFPVWDWVFAGVGEPFPKLVHGANGIGLSEGPAVSDVRESYPVRVGVSIGSSHCVLSDRHRLIGSPNGREECDESAQTNDVSQTGLGC